VTARRPGRRLAALTALLAAVAMTTGCERPGDRGAAELYAKYCARCHGADGRGVPRQLARYPRADLTLSEARGDAARDFFHRRIAEGYGPMPGFSRRLSPQELERLVDYSLAIARTGAPPDGPAGGR
jgi:mono/diheme cytochrome c family protein